MSFAGRVLRREVVAAPPPTPQTDYNSPALRKIAERLQGESRHTLLDLGAASGPTLEFLSQFPCKLFVADVCLATAEFNARDEDDRLLVGEAIDRLLTFKPDTRFDIFLAWDLFNYLERDAAQAVAEHLSQYAARDALLYTLISTTARQPAQPNFYKILSSDRLRYEVRGADEMDSPRLPQHEVQRRLSGFTQQHTYLLQNGMQEYVFRY